MTTIVKACVCKHTFQDEKYGAGMRLHRVATKKEAIPRERCTVCFQTTPTRRLQAHAREWQPKYSV